MKDRELTRFELRAKLQEAVEEGQIRSFVEGEEFILIPSQFDTTTYYSKHARKWIENKRLVESKVTLVVDFVATLNNGKKIAYYINTLGTNTAGIGMKTKLLRWLYGVRCVLIPRLEDNPDAVIDLHLEERYGTGKKDSARLPWRKLTDFYKE